MARWEVCFSWTVDALVIIEAETEEEAREKGEEEYHQRPTEGSADDGSFQVSGCYPLVEDACARAAE